MIHHDTAISGADFQSFAQLTFCTEEKLRDLHTQMLPNHPIMLQSGGDINPHLNLVNGKSTDLKLLRTIFCYGDTVRSFYNYGLKYLDGPLEIIVHNSDQEFSSKYLPLLNDPKVSLVFAQNATFEHQKLIGIPIGLANNWWPHGKSNFDKILSKIERPNRKCVLYANFSASTHPSRTEYSVLLSQLRSSKVLFESNVTQFQYITNLLSCKYVFCPRGNGIDTHRFWEAVYCGATPVAFKSDSLRIHLDFKPILLSGIKELMEFALSLDGSNVDDTLFDTVKQKIMLSHWRQILTR